jgi:acyl carrier protein
MERQIAEVWEQVLIVNRERIGIHDNFFDLGGDSIKVIRVSGQLKKILNREIPITTFFEYPTIHSLAEFLTLQEKGKSEPNSDDEDILRNRQLDEGRVRRFHKRNRRKN